MFLQFQFPAESLRNIRNSGYVAGSQSVMQSPGNIYICHHGDMFLVISINLVVVMIEKDKSRLMGSSGPVLNCLCINCVPNIVCLYQVVRCT